MLSNCLKCRNDTRDINPNVSNTSNVRIMLLSKSTACNSKKSRFVKQQEASGVLSKLGIRTTLNEISL